MDQRGFFYFGRYIAWSSSGTLLLAQFDLVYDYPFMYLMIENKSENFGLVEQVWDGTQCKKVRTMGGHQTRTGVLAWNSRILASGSRDRNILQHDMRVSSDFVGKLVGHKSEVKRLCKLCVVPHTQ